MVMMLVSSLAMSTRELKALQVQGQGRQVALPDFVKVIHRKIFDTLRLASRGPEDLGPLDRLRPTQADLLSQRRTAEAASGADGLVDVPLPLSGLNHNLDASSDCGTIGLGPFQLEGYPMIAVARILV